MDLQGVAGDRYKFRLEGGQVRRPLQIGYPRERQNHPAGAGGEHQFCRECDAAHDTRDVLGGDLSVAHQK